MLRLLREVAKVANALPLPVLRLQGERAGVLGTIIPGVWDVWGVGL